MATEPQKFKKKQGEVIAEQFVVYNKSDNPTSRTINGILFPVYKDDRGYYVMVPNPAGLMRCNNLDWIVKESDGEMYVYTDDRFNKTHSKVI